MSIVDLLQVLPPMSVAEIGAEKGIRRYNGCWWVVGMDRVRSVVEVSGVVDAGCLGVPRGPGVSGVALACHPDSCATPLQAWLVASFLPIQ